MTGHFRLIIEPKGALLLGGTSQPGVNDATARDVDGQPIIPATAIKGALREQLVRILQATEPETASAAVQRILGSAPASRIAAEGNSFRSDEVRERPGGGRTRVYLGNARLCDEKTHTALARSSFAVAARHQVSIDRYRRRASEQRLFSREVVAPFLGGLVFIADVDATLLVADPEHGSADLKRLQAAAKAVFAIGSSRSSGMGHVAMRLEPAPEAKRSDLSRGLADAAAPASSAQVEIPDATSILLLLEAEDPLCVADRLLLSNFHASLGYIRGSTLRGALVTAAMRAQGVRDDMTNDPSFARTLIDADTCMRFGDAACVEIESTALVGPAVAPLTLRTCKYGGSGHGCLDTLVLRWIQQRLATEGAFLAFDEHCQHESSAGGRCGERLVASADRLGTAEPSRRVVTRLALDTRMGRGAEGKLFSIDLLDRGTRFLARIDRVGDDGRALLEHAQCAPIRAGHGRSQGYGRLRIVDACAVEDASSMDRLDRFDAAVRDAWQAACTYAALPEAAADPAPGRIFVSVTLENDLVPQRKTPGKPAIDALIDALELEDATVLYAAVRAGQRGGYDNRNDRFKNLEAVIRGRSCVLLSVPDDDEHRRRLAAIETGGIGRWRNQGYGRARIADALHLPGWKADWRITP